MNFFDQHPSRAYIKQHIHELREVIEHHRQKYYTDQPEISDSEFDTLFALLKSWETQFPEYILPSSPTQTVRFVVQSELKKAQHLVPMISLDNAYTKGEMEEWETRMKKYIPSESLEYVIEPKFDGLGISCIFHDGVLVRALTRGDGTIGEDVTENMKTFLPQCRIPKDISPFEIRGEVIMKKSDFRELNASLARTGKKLFSNPRNAAAGSLRQLDTSITKSRNLSVFFYETPLFEQQKHFETYANVLEFFLNNSIPHTPEYFVCHSIAEVMEKIQYMQHIRSSLDYDIDGAVIKVNSFSLRKSIGETAHHPRWAIAYKFPAVQVHAQIRCVEWQVGRTGVVTPVAHLEPVMIDGVTISRATLHNAEYIKQKKVHIGDTVILERSGDVIPKIIMALPEYRTGAEQEIYIPSLCPGCRSPLSQKNEEVALRCTNPNCIQMLHGKIQHFASKKAMNIDGLGTQSAKTLIEKKLVTVFSDIFALQSSDLLQIEGWKEKSSEHLISSIQKSRKNPLWRWIHAVCIPLVGEKTAKLLSQHYPHESDLFSATKESLLEIQDIGERMAEEIVVFFAEKKNRTIFSFRIDDPLLQNNSPDSQVFAGKVFVFTGSLSSMSRGDAQEKVELRGGSVSSSISKQVSVVVCGENAGSKRNKAEALGLEIWTEEQFLSQCREQILPCEGEEREHNQSALF